MIFAALGEWHGVSHIVEARTTYSDTKVLLLDAVPQIDPNAAIAQVVSRCSLTGTPWRFRELQRLTSYLNSRIPYRDLDVVNIMEMTLQETLCLVHLSASDCERNLWRFQIISPSAADCRWASVYTLRTPQPIR